LKDRYLKQSPDRIGYLRVKIHTSDGRRTLSVHRLVANAFYDCDLSVHEINHIDGDKQNNFIWNLEVCTRSENMLHAFTHGLAKPVFEPLKIRIRETNLIFDSTGQVDRYLNVSSGSVSKTLRGLQPTCRGYTFEVIGGDAK
jgi:HNH endonuclease